MPRKRIEGYIEDLRDGRRIPLVTFPGYSALLVNTVLASALLIGFFIALILGAAPGRWYAVEIVVIMGVAVAATDVWLWGSKFRAGIQVTADCLKHWDWRGREHSVLLTDIERVASRRSFVHVFYTKDYRSRRASLDWLHAKIGDALVALLAERAGLGEHRRRWVGLNRADVWERHDPYTREALE